MGKKAKKASGIAKASMRKLDKAMLPPPPVPVEEEVCVERERVKRSECPLVA